MVDRRLLLAGLAAAAAVPAFAQTQPDRTPVSGAAGGAEMRYIQQTTTIGALALATSRIAQEKAQFPKLKEFAGFEIAEQETMADVLKSLMNPSTGSGTVQPPSEAEVEQHLDAEGKQILTKLRAAQAGAAFDSEYLHLQTDYHRKLLRIQQDYLNSGQNLDSLNVARLASGLIKEHQQLLTDVLSEMGNATTGASPRLK